MTDINWTPPETWYMYSGDIYCDDCGKSIVAVLNNTVDEDYHDDLLYEDSSTWPIAYPQTQGETDSPDHCAECQRFLGRSLTSDGILYVQESASEDLERDGKVGDTVQGWLDYYGIEEVACND